MPRFEIPHLLPELAPIPDWLRQAAQGENALFAAGAAFTLLHPLAKSDAPPAMLWRRRLALNSAAAITGAMASSIRDHWIIRKPGDDPGPAGRVYGAMRQLTQSRPLRHLAELPAQFDMAAAPELLEVLRHCALQNGTPLKQACAASAAILRHDTQARGLALWVSDALLAKALGWERPLPLLAPYIKRADYRLAIEAPDLWEQSVACAYARAAIDAYGTYADLHRRAAKLLGVAGKLRGKDAGDGIMSLLSDDALSAQAGRLTSDRAARRFFERLMELGVLRELTGRTSFRLYGL